MPDNIRRCTQMRYAYYLEGGCRRCDGCHAMPYVIDESCPRCVECESEEGIVRWDDGQPQRVGNMIMWTTE